MISINIYKEKNQISKILIKGHSIKGKKGNNIICAAVSSLVNFLVIGLNEIAKINLTIKAAKEGEFELNINENIFDNSKSEAIYLTFIKSLEWINTKYPDNVKINYV